MPFLRAAVTTVVAALLLLALVGWGHLLPWHRERPQAVEASDIEVQEAGIPTRPVEEDAGAQRDKEPAAPLLPLPRVEWDRPHGEEDSEPEDDEEEDDDPKPKRGKGWGRGWT